MTCMQRSGTGRDLGHHKTGACFEEDCGASAGLQLVDYRSQRRSAAFHNLVKQRLYTCQLAVIIALRNILLAAVKIKQYEKCGASH
jgi:hypothetical protein